MFEEQRVHEWQLFSNKDHEFFLSKLVVRKMGTTSGFGFMQLIDM